MLHTTATAQVYADAEDAAIAHQLTQGIEFYERHKDKLPAAASSPSSETLSPTEAIWQETYCAQKNGIEHHFHLTQPPRPIEEWQELLSAMNMRYGLGLRKGDIAVFATMYAGQELPEIEAFRSETEQNLIREGLLTPDAHLGKGGLQYARRLGDVPHTALSTEENTGAHSFIVALTTADVLDYYGYDAGINANNAPIQEFARQMMLASLFHDFGEFYNEINTEFGRNKGQTSVDKYALERDIFKGVYSIYRAALMQSDNFLGEAFSEEDFALGWSDIEEYFLVGNECHPTAKFANFFMKTMDKISGNEGPIRGFMDESEWQALQETGETGKQNPYGLDIAYLPFGLASNRYLKLCVTLAEKPLRKMMEAFIDVATSLNTPTPQQLHAIPQNLASCAKEDAVTLRSIPKLAEALLQRNKFFEHTENRNTAQVLGYLARGPLYRDTRHETSENNIAPGEPASIATAAERTAYQHRLGRARQLAHTQLIHEEPATIHGRELIIRAYERLDAPTATHVESVVQPMKDVMDRAGWGR